MKIISHKNKLVKFIHNEKKLGFVPTMGGIHLGHISLIKIELKVKLGMGVLIEGLITY